MKPQQYSTINYLYNYYYFKILLNQFSFGVISNWVSAPKENLLEQFL